jgi:hypothetical protein
MPRKTRSKPKHFFCGHRNYLNGSFLSPISQCEGCPCEKHDLFTGTAGLQRWAYYCSFNPEVEMKNSG